MTTEEQLEATRTAWNEAHAALSLHLRSIGLLCIEQPDGNINIGPTNRAEFARLVEADTVAYKNYLVGRV
jgi:hypothetical protein